MEDAIEYAKQANADETIRQIMWDRERYWIDRSLDHGEWYDEGQKSRQPEVDKLKKEVDTEKNRADEAEARADEAIAGQTDMIRNMISKGKTKEDIIDLTGITEERYAALMKSN